ncbi:MAG: hypothetical protein JSV80_00210 [Acidobacteriota bacterium]|nr:MAG: hypothetical protein JSV80_00210 [Acidobacteriota bacterium]
MRDRFWGFIVVAAWLGSAGCATHLHRASDFQLAVEARAAFETARLSEAGAIEREQLAGMLERELAAVRTHTLALRDAELVAILESEQALGDDGRLACGIETRSQQIAGARYREYLAVLIGKVEPARRAMISAQQQYQRLTVAGTVRPAGLTCPLSPAARAAIEEADLDAALRAVITEYGQQCGAYLAALDDLGAELVPPEEGLADRCPLAETDFPSPLLADLLSILEQARQATEAFDRALGELRGRYARARREHRQAETSRAPVLRTEARAALEELAAIGGPLADASSLLRSVGLEELSHGAIEALVEAQLELVSLLLAISAEEPGSGDPSADRETAFAIELLRLIPAIEEEIQAGFSRPRLQTLVFEAELLRARLEAAGRQRTLAQARQRLLMSEKAALVAELELLVEAGKHLARYRASPGACPPIGSLVAAFSDASPACREQLLLALALYAHSWSTARTSEEQLDYELIALRHEAALDSSEAALAQWEVLIGLPLMQLVAYHKSGLEPDDIARMTEILGILGIAVGVN